MEMKTEEYQNKIIEFLNHLEGADAILVGAASGMSAAAGHTYYYERSRTFVDWFGDFEKKYGFHNAFDGFYQRYRTREEFWAYTAQLIKLIYHGEGGQPYADLAELLKNKNYHVLTTNQDALFTQICPEEKISAIQGDWRYFQCKHRCHDQIYPNREQVENQNKKLLFLELGVGRMTPMFIQQPFWNLTSQLPGAFYITINPRDARMPRELADKGLLIGEDIAAVFRDAVNQMKK